MPETAVLLMMPEGDTPDAADFAAGDRFASFEDAIRAAHERAGPDASMVPWIRFGGTLIDPSSVMATNTPPAPPRVAEGSEVGDRLDDDLSDTFPASDPPASSQP